MTVPHEAPRILVIDDDPVALAAMAHVLTQRGQMQVRTAPGPVQALDLLAGTAFDGVVTDVQMPEMTGPELLEQLESTAPGLPVVVVTAETSVDTALQVIRSRAAAFAFKPLDPDKLVAAVRRALSTPAVVEAVAAGPRRRLFRR